MNAQLKNKPLVPFGWLRALLFVAVYFALLLTAGLVLDKFQPKAVAETAQKGIPYLSFIVNAVIAVAVTWLFRRFIDARSFESMGFSFEKNGASAGTGFFLGIFLMCAGSCVLFFGKNLVWTNISFNGNELFISFGLMVIIALYEEMVFRGYILNNLLESVNKWIALLITALVFMAAHVSNPAFSVAGAVNILLAGILLGLNYIYTRNLWFGIMLHFTWNFFQGPLLGYPLSGMPQKSLLEHEVHGNNLITGGSFGYEGSLVATVFFLLAIAAMAWMYEKKYSAPVIGAQPA